MQPWDLRQRGSECLQQDRMALHWHQRANAQHRDVSVQRFRGAVCAESLGIVTKRQDLRL